jgi:putative peptidoglycan lipid II flippase
MDSTKLTQKDGSTSYRTMAAAVFWISLISIISKILGFGREMALGAVFGISYQTDAYFVAMSIPTVIFSNFFVPLQTTTIPVYTKYLQKSKLKAQKLAGSLFYCIAFLSLASAFLGFIFAPYLIRLLAPKFSGETYTLTVELARMMIPAIPFIALAPVATALLHSHRSFLLPAAVGFPFNLILIFTILYFGSQYGIAAVAIALVIALASQFIMLLPGLLRLNIVKWGCRDLDFTGVKEILVLTLPVLIGLVGNDINLLVDRILASGLPEGSIAALTFANRLNSMPHALFGVTLLTVFYPQLSRLAVENNIVEFKSCLERAAAAIMFLLVPAMVGFMVLRTPIIQVLFQREAFDEHATAMTSVALLYYAIGLLGVPLTGLLTRAFYSLRDTKTPVIVTFISVTINIVLNLILIRHMAHAGLALATSISTLTGLALTYLLIQIKIGGINGRKVFQEASKIFSAASLMGLVIWMINLKLAYIWDKASELKQAVALFFIIGLGAFIYFMVSYLFQIKEVYFFGNLVQNRLKKYKQVLNLRD